MRVWRLARAAYPALDGEGARRYGGRWNAPGVPVVYTATSLPLAVLELLVHVDADTVPLDLVAYEIEVPDNALLRELDPADLPAGWERAAACAACRDLGAAWLAAGETIGLVVPSAVVPAERCVLLNPRQADAARLRVVQATPFAFDDRLLA